MNKSEFETYVSLRKKIMKLSQKYFNEVVLPEISAPISELTDEDTVMTDVWCATKTNVTVANEMSEGHDIPARYFYDPKFRKTLKQDKEKARKKIKAQQEKEVEEQQKKQQDENKKQLRSLMLQYPDEVEAFIKLTTIKKKS